MRKKTRVIIFCILVLFFSAEFVNAQENTILFYPEIIYQGEPLMIQVNTNPTSVKKITFGGVPVSIFKYKNRPTGIVGMDLNKTPGVYYVTTEFWSGDISTSSVEIKKKKIKTAPYTIPEKLGGNTWEGKRNLVSSLAEENNAFKNIKTGKKTWWISGFVSPLEKTKINDEFGYYRQLGNMIMAHKGVDYMAVEGTKVMSANDGIVRMVGDYRNYGKTVVIDHGLGVLSFYLHLSEIKVKAGEFVLKGQTIGLSGETGYADSPHLHFSIRVYGVSVDPVKFLELFK